MKNIFRKNQVIISALVLMIIIAGYLNFTQDRGKKAQDQAAVEAGSTDLAEIPGEELDDTLLGANDVAGTDNQEEVLVTDPEADGNELLQTDTTTGTEDQATTGTDTQTTGTSEKELGVKDNGELQTADGSEDAVDAENTESNGEAVLANAPIGSSYFASSKLSREQLRAKNQETLMDLIESTNISEAQKQDAIQSMLSLTTKAEIENAIEASLEAKGFEYSVVRVMDDLVDVIVSGDNLTDQQVAIIQDIVKKRANVTSDKITITPVPITKE